MSDTSNSDAVRGRLRWFLNGCSNLSDDWPPPATNAASDKWCSNTVSDPVLKLPIETPPDADPEVTAFYNLARNFQKGLLRSLDHTAAHGSFDKYPAVIVPVIEHLAGNVFRVGSDIWDLYAGSPVAKAAALASLRTDMEALIRRINEEGTAISGDYANGYVAQDIHDVADTTLSALALLPKSNNQDAMRLAETLRIVCAELKNLDTTGHTPWLKAEYQVAYQGILRAAADGLGA